MTWKTFSMIILIPVILIVILRAMNPCIQIQEGRTRAGRTIYCLR